ncbi:M15 family metallopeptidase [Macrococcoides caseolyticum]|uniref:M15 family metallopeptidase n=1 Tax=Macrococcoides caseolyticum TaxID=69966 RepID=UPI002D80E2F4|nr:M15 family metallopeptidase [Macrococcus caseolyticus]MCE4957470.1 M15 family metallopeptidase [Macrococcus caseolyticus]
MKRIMILALLLSGCSTHELDKNDEQVKTVTKKPAQEKPQKKKPKYEKKVINGVTYINGIVIVNKKISLPKSYHPGENQSVRKILNQMMVDAQKDNMHLVIRSGYRSYAAQKILYDQFVAQNGLQYAESYSAMPGHSEHQTGLAYDIGSRESAQNSFIQFGQTKEGKWLSEHAHEYGFIIRYPKGKTAITGYQYEPWHIRYVGKIHAARLYQTGKTLEEYLGLYKKTVIKPKQKVKQVVSTELPETTEAVTLPQSTESVTLEHPVTVESSVTTEMPMVAPESTVPSINSGTSVTQSTEVPQTYLTE